MPDDLVLQPKEIAACGVKPLGPELVSRVHVHELHIDAYLVAVQQCAAFKHIAQIELAPNLPGINGLPVVGEGGLAGDDEAARQRSGEIGRQTVGDSVDKVVLGGIARQIDEWQDDDRERGSRCGLDCNTRFGVRQ